MAEWGNAALFAGTVLAFVLGLSSIIMGFLPTPAGVPGNGMKEKVEYGFFGFSAIVIGVLLLIALIW